jgi:tryptophan synthase alpha chain
MPPLSSLEYDYVKNRIKDRFTQCAENGRKAFVAYIAAGDPDFEKSLAIVDALVSAGVDIIELGVPFSDPLADGEANQLAATRAIDSGMSAVKVLELAREIRRKHEDLPLVLFTYLNPIAYSAELDFEKFCVESVKSGIDAMLLLDLPPEERDCEWAPGKSYNASIKNAGLPLVALVAPTTSEERIPLLLESADAFVYYVSREGVTGEGDEFSAGFANSVKAIKRHTNIPVVVGFGISTPDHVRAASSTGVDGVVVGSAIVRRVEAYSKGEATLDDLEKFVLSMTLATN